MKFVNGQKGALVLALLLAGGDAFAAVGRQNHGRDRASDRREDRVVVKMKDSAMGRQRLETMRLLGARAKAVVPHLGIATLPVPTGETPESFVQRLKSEAGQSIEFAEVDRKRMAMATPSDPLLASQTHLTVVGVSSAWDTTSGSGVTIAIADTGVRTVHPDLSANLVTGYNVLDGTTNIEDDDGHGTPVSGTAAAVGNNAIGVAGVAYSARILPINISDDGSAFDSDIAAAITHAANSGAKVVNVSFNGCVPGLCWGNSVLSAAAYMRSRGGLVTVAAGNGDCVFGIGYDSTCDNDPEIINVGATTDTDARTSFSNYGAELDVMAPGQAVLTTNCDDDQCGSSPNGDYASASGTSFSAPLVAGVLGLIFAVDPSFTADQAQQILFDSARDLGTPGYDTGFGWGRVDAARAVSLAQERSTLFQLNNLSNVYAYPNPWDIRRNANRQMTFANLPDAATVKLFTLSGFWVQTLTASNGRATWDLRNNSGDLVASGLYFYLVDSPTGAQVKGKIAVIK